MNTSVGWRSHVERSRVEGLVKIRFGWGASNPIYLRSVAV